MRPDRHGPYYTVAPQYGDVVRLRFARVDTFALAEAHLVLASIAQRYRLRLLPGHPVLPDPIFTLRTSHGLPMLAERRR